MEVWASWAGALVAAVSAGLVLWVRWRDRPQVLWHFGLDGLIADRRQRASLMLDGRDPHRLVRLTNVGDGNAHAVTVSGENLAAQFIELGSGDTRGFSTPPVVGLVPPNGTALVAVYALYRVGEDGSKIIDGDMVLTVEWTEGPVRHKRHRRQSLCLAGNEPGPREPRRMKGRSLYDKPERTR